jgi:hypothetical protein
VDFDRRLQSAIGCRRGLAQEGSVHHSFHQPFFNDMNDFRKVRDDMEREIIYLLVNYAN